MPTRTNRRALPVAPYANPLACLVLALSVILLSNACNKASKDKSAAESVDVKSLVAAPGGLRKSVVVAPTTGVVPLTFMPQQGDYLCWAASAEMIMSYLGNDIQQCTQATDNPLNPNNHQACCPIVRGGPCDASGWPNFPKYGFVLAAGSPTQSIPLSFDDLKQEILNNRAVAFSWRYLNNDGTLTNDGHMMVAVGFSDANGQSVQIADPLANSGTPVTGTIDSAQYVSSATYKHWNDYYGITKGP